MPTHAKLSQIFAVRPLTSIAQIRTPPRGGGLFLLSGRKAYDFSLRRTTPARPINPVPSRPSEPGSGTTMFVSPLPTVAESSKNPLPVLIVNWNVVPTVLNPDAVV